jgi:ATP/maltotriose-dependent transcriptional regulator MalT
MERRAARGRGQSPGVAHALSDLAEVLLQRASPDAARAVCEGALALLAGEADRDERAHILRVLGTMHRIAGRTDRAPLLMVFPIQLARAYHNSWMTVRLAVHLNSI